MFSRKQFNSGGKGNRVSASLIARKLTNRFHEKSVRLALIAGCVTSFFSFLSFEKTWKNGISNRYRILKVLRSVNTRFLFDVTFNFAPNFSSRVMKTHTIFFYTQVNQDERRRSIERVRGTIIQIILLFIFLANSRKNSSMDSPRFPLFHGSLF